jgi:CubicO group peptidase (beta-lactamase class C family)
MRGGLTYDLNMPSIRALKEKDPNADTLSVVKSFAATPLSFEPGTRYQYSLCHDVLGAVIEVASGMKFGEYLKKEIFEPLGMTRTFFNYDDTMLDQFAAQYRLNGDKYDEVEKSCVYRLTPAYESGGAGLVSCLDDYAKFAVALANKGTAPGGYQLLRPETVDLMRVNQNDVDVNLPGPVRPGLGYGFGVRVMLDKRLASSDAPTEFEFGWDGAAGTYVTIDAHHNLTSVYTQHVLGHGWVYTDVHPVIRDTAYYLAGIVK